jgi:hypothetical protein
LAIITTQSTMDIKTFSFSAATPPLAVIAAAKLAGFSPSIDTSLPSDTTPAFLFSDGFVSSFQSNSCLCYTAISTI